MKKLLMMVAMAVGVTVSADSQNDKLISFSTSGTSYYQDGLTKIVDNECFALVWTKDGSTFGGFNADGTLKDGENNKLVRVVNFAKDGHCPPITFVIPADEVEGIYAGGSFAVYLLDTRDANGQPTVAQNNTIGLINWFSKCDDSGSEVDAAEDVAKAFNSYICTYADGKRVLEGERCVLVQSDENGVFSGITWQGVPEDAVVATFFADKDSKFAISLEGKIEAGKTYELIVLDSRIPDGSVLASKLGETLVSAFGEFTLNSDGSAIEGVKWNAVKMGLSATYPVLQHAFSYDPTLILEKGYAVVSPEDGKWQVYKLPEAWVAPYESPELSLKNGTYWHLGKNKDVIPDPFKLESAYKFSAFDIQYEKKALAYLSGKTEELVPADYKLLDDWNKQVTPFKEWNADFEVSFDRPVAANSVLLAGFYNYTSAWAGKYTFDWVGEGQQDPWVGSSPEKDLAAGEVTRLLYSYIGKSGNVTMTYNEICQKVIQFFCGVKNLSEKNYGTTMTVKLCIYENTGRCHESGRRVVIGTYDYTFCGPLGFRFRKGEGHPDGVDLPYPGAEGDDELGAYTSLSTNHNGKLSFVLPALQSGSNTLAFVGWSNAVDSTIMTYVPTNTWGNYNLYSTWKKAKTIVITPDTNKTETVASIKVADDWIEKNLKDVPTEKVAEALQKPAEDGGKIPLWQTYVLGLNPSGTVSVVATEKLSDDKALVVSTVEAPAPDAGFKVTYSLDKIDKTSEEPIDPAHKGKEQETKDIAIDLEPQGGETPTGYYKMNVFITPVKDDVAVKDEQVQVKSEVTVGVLTVKTEEPVVPVAIPWTSLAGNGDDANAKIPADEIVQPQGLTEGDELMVYNRDNEVYTTLTLKGGKWVADGTTVPVNEGGTSGEATQPGEVPMIGRGYSMWLKRQDPSATFHLFGQYNKAEAATTIDPGSAEKSEYNLIAPTGIEDTDLNEIPSLKSNSTNVNPNDIIVIVRDGAPVRYRPVGDGKWGYKKQVYEKKNGIIRVKTENATDAKVQAGVGMWYISAGGNPTIKWESDESASQD